MIIGQTVFGGTYFSPWFPRNGDAAVFAAEVFTASGSGAVMVGVQTKNRDDTDPGYTQGGTLGGTIAGGSLSSALSTGVGNFSANGFKEFVRFYYAVSNSSSQWVHFRVLPPAWRMNGA